MIGEVIGDYIVIERLENKNNKTIVKTLCSICGMESLRYYDDLKRNIGILHKSCIFRVEDKATKRFGKIFYDMKERCNNPKKDKYMAYGGRGIKCLYQNLIDFYNDKWEEYKEHSKIHGEKNTTIERIDVNGDYEKNNITWATWEQQYNNTNQLFYFKAISPTGCVFIEKNLAKFCRNHDLKRSSVAKAIKNNKPFRNWEFIKIPLDVETIEKQDYILNLVE